NNPLVFPLHHEHRRKNHNWPNLEGKVLMDSKLIYNRKLGYWTFVWVYGKNVKNCNDIQVAENLNIVAIDPGVRIGWVWYSPSKGCGWFGNLDINRVFRLSLSLDDLISRAQARL
ncbi:40379_t:CDS:2, partial [Gigaspora margarita]